MFKIKLLILLLLSIIFFSCSNSINQKSNIKYSLKYIGEGYDGLIFSNLLKYHLKSYNLLDQNSKFEIKANITHTPDIYITNIDNTSDRENIKSIILIDVYDSELKCNTYTFSEELSQFYIFAPGAKFISNDKASERIKFDNTELLVKKFLNDVLYRSMECEKKDKVIESK